MGLRTLRGSYERWLKRWKDQCPSLNFFPYHLRNLTAVGCWGCCLRYLYLEMGKKQFDSLACVVFLDCSSWCTGCPIKPAMCCSCWSDLKFSSSEPPLPLWCLFSGHIVLDPIPGPKTLFQFLKQGLHCFSHPWLLVWKYPHQLVYLEIVQVQVKGCRVTLDCYLWSIPTSKELLISCTLKSHARGLTFPSVHKEAFISKTLIYVYYLMLHIKWKDPHFQERRLRQAEDWSWGGGWKANRGFAALALMLHK